MNSETEYKGVFDLSNAEGVTDSERLLVRLCRRSFLSLWSHANLHTDEGQREGKGSAKEFADVLVVFGDDVVLFSDKHVAFNESKPLDVAWKRWYKRAIQQSAQQLYGALNWVRRFPERIYLDAKCTRPLPVSLPPQDRARYHLVAVTRGTRQACAKHFSGSLGSLLIRSDLEGDAHEQAPFTVGRIDRDKPFVHVFDEVSLEIVLTEQDTITDFVTYLRAREELLTNQATAIAAAGEEQLVAAYLRNMNGDDHVFLPPIRNGRSPDLVVFDESHYAGLRSRPEYQEKKRVEADSYLWDEIVERFIKLGDPAVVHPAYRQGNQDTEQALRVIAAESRFRRRVLVDALRGLVLAAQQTPGRSRARLCLAHQHPDLLYIFLVVPKRSEDNYDEYRKHRAAMLHAYCRCAKLKFPAVTTFIGIGTDHPLRDYPGLSEDLLIYTCKELTEEERAEAEDFRRKLGILGDGMTMQETHDDEFPQVERETIYRARHKGTSKEAALKATRRAKRKARIAKASRRRNRNK